MGAEPLGEFLHVAGLLLPLYAPRALEVQLFGLEGASLATAAPIADCFEIAYYCCRNSMLHPKFKRLPPLHTYIWLGNDERWRNQRDPLALGLDEQLGCVAESVLACACARACVLLLLWWWWWIHGGHAELLPETSFLAAAGGERSKVNASCAGAALCLLPVPPSSQALRPFNNCSTPLFPLYLLAATTSSR